MNIVVAIDIKKGLVVKAIAGIRNNYKPLSINKKDYSNPFSYIKFLNRTFNIKKIYIADLDSICGSRENWKIIVQIVQENPSISFFLDLGFKKQKMLNDFQDLIISKKTSKKHFNFIIGTELLKDVKSLSGFYNKSEMLVSLDFNGSESLWINNISKLMVFDKIVLMFIKQVGGRGINWKVLKNLRIHLNPTKTIIAGGIQNNQDIRKLKNIGYYGIIISSLIHKKIKLRGHPPLKSSF